MKNNLTRRTLVLCWAMMTAWATTITTNAALAQSSNQIILLGKEIRPAVLNISPRNYVFFETQSSDTTYRIVADDGSFDTGDLAPGQLSESFFLEAEGNVTYHCERHPEMTGLISVTN